MIWVGTSGWQYDDWRKRFYPERLPKKDWLRFFAAHFPTVEVNNTFYRMPDASTFRRWREETRPGTVVTVKASRFITHIKRLVECRDAIALLWERAGELGPKLGPILFQLPPRFAFDSQRLERFLSLLPDGMQAAFEFRDRSWERDETYEALDRAGAAFVQADWPGIDPPNVVTGGWSYVRLHKGSTLRPGYTQVKLRRWAQRIERMPARTVFVYFNNDPTAAAVRNALTLQRLLPPREVIAV